MSKYTPTGGAGRTTGTTGTTGQNQSWMEEMGFGEWEGESKYFTEIDSAMEAATQRDMYQPFFEAQTKKLQGDVLGAMGQTGKGMGFAGSTAQDTVMTKLEDAYAGQVMAVEEDIQSKMDQAQRNINDVEASNVQTALTLKGMKQGEDAGGPHNSWWDNMNIMGGKNRPGACVVTTALNASGVWSNSQKRDAVNWCKDTHHDGTLRGNTWIKGYHTWGKFLSKWVKKSRIVRYIVDVTTDAFIDVVKRNKRNYLGYIIHYMWVNPLSYIIGFTKNHKILGTIITSLMIVLYTILFPLFGIVSIPYMIKRELKK